MARRVVLWTVSLLAVGLVLLVAIVVIIGMVAVRTVDSAVPSPDPSFDYTEFEDVAAPVDAEGETSSDWAQQTGGRLGIPARAVQAYAAAAAWAAEERPGCQIGWNTLAGIGSIESHHGTINDASVGDDGWIQGRIIGPRLDGSGSFASVPDTDGGELDGDDEYDRAVGPMQFLPETFSRYAVDGNGDGQVDPHQYDDATFTAANYLCANDRVLSDDEDWITAILAYNASHDYVAAVYDEAVWYAENA